MDPIRCVMLISAAGRVRKAESPEATPAEALLLNLAGKLKHSQSATCGKKEGIQLSWNALAPGCGLLRFLCFGWRLGSAVIGAHDVIESLFLGDCQKSSDFGMRGVLA